jgi:hypothetical protein
MQRKYFFCRLLILLGALLLLTACGSKSSCPPITGTPRYLTVPPDQLPTPIPVAGPVDVKIGNEIIKVDKVVSGPLCNDTWSGTVYVSCKVQVYSWQKDPTFLKNCNLSIAPGTVVYVAYHNDTAYYNGCSCHTGEVAGP